MYLIIDNYDSFVYNLFMYFKELGEEIKLIRNDKITTSLIKELEPEGIIISPGPKDPKDTGNLLEIIEEFKGEIPILGICLGHQSIAYAYGAKIVKGKVPVHGKVSLITHNNEGVFTNIKNPLKVTRYHSLIVDEDTLPSEFIITSKSEDNVIMGIRHKKDFIEGVQFHPEALLTEMGHELLENFIIQSKEFNRKKKRGR
ncbi:anthranilate synthase component II [Hathewaya limosa]|uniref:Para-aminobenzoate synthetase component 2 n=1 Tax=Hathewaya limosa TaxID=1536 RepID=A0ABU0JSN9_HATLI|nr:aminodeoxychorismate/anthranilate synthase component II [Hathewaya limosa]MDQ0479183.1 para-aminobenzoate synthetase component 2 [Hathewaya limosa]